MAVSFGVVLLVNDQTVALQPKQVVGEVSQKAGNLKANGMELELDRPLQLGSPGAGKDALEDLVKKFDSNFSMPTKNDLPDEVKDLVDRLESVEITVEKFHLKIPGSAAKSTGVRYTVGMSAIFPPGRELGVAEIPVALKGMFFEVSNEGEATGT